MFPGRIGTTLSVHIFLRVKEKAQPSHCSHVQRSAIRKGPATVLFPCRLKAIGNVLSITLFSCTTPGYENSVSRDVPMHHTELQETLLRRHADEDSTVSSLLQTQSETDKENK